MTDTATTTPAEPVETAPPTSAAGPTLTPEVVLPRDLPSDFREAAKIEKYAATLVGAVDPAVLPFLHRLTGIRNDLRAIFQRVESFASDLESHATGKTAPTIAPQTVTGVLPASPPVSSTEPIPTTLSPGDQLAAAAAGMTTPKSDPTPVVVDEPEAVAPGTASAALGVDAPAPPEGFTASTGTDATL